jgi:hypothetical protein
MPFAEKYREVYEQVYKPVCEANNLKCWRVDEIALPTSITNDIVQGIVDADIIIADLTSKNANVFYELGIAHTIGAQVIMTCQSMEDIPFDIGNYRVIKYEQTISGSKILADKLNQAITELLVALNRINNPVQAVLSNKIINVKKRTLLMEIINFSGITKELKNMIQEENILYADELKQLDLDVVKGKYHLGQKGLSQLLSVIIENRLYDNLEKLQEFAIKHRLSGSLPTYNRFL